MDLTTKPWRRPPVRSDLPPELPTGKEGEGPTEAQRVTVLREAVNYYIRTSFRAPDVRKICEEFIAAADVALGGGGTTDPPLPDVPGVSITPTSGTVVAAGGTGSIAVAITEPGISGTWTVDKDADALWLTYTPMTPQSADGTINWTAAANLGVLRVAHLYINGKTFTLSQDGAV
jgi:hypothetical protein